LSASNFSLFACLCCSCSARKLRNGPARRERERERERETGEARNQRHGGEDALLNVFSIHRMCSLSMNVFTSIVQCGARPSYFPRTEESIFSLRRGASWVFPTRCWCTAHALACRCTVHAHGRCKRSRGSMAMRGSSNRWNTLLCKHTAGTMCLPLRRSCVKTCDCEQDTLALIGSLLVCVLCRLCHRRLIPCLL